MKKILVAVLSLVLVMNSASFRAEASDKTVFDKSKVDESFVKLLETEPDLLLEQYGNVVDIQTMTLSTKSRSSEGIEIEACVYGEDGVAHLLEAEATLTKVIYQDVSFLSLSDDENLSTLYVLSTSADEKVSDESGTQEGVTLYAAITWIDHVGLQNELVSLSGSRSGSYTGDGSYVCNARTTPVTSGEFEESFNDSNKKGQKGYSFTLSVFSKSTSGKTVKVMAKTSAFD